MDAETSPVVAEGDTDAGALQATQTLQSELSDEDKTNRI